MKCGIDQCIGDTLGPGGVFRALRTIPVVLEIARDMEELCPKALLSTTNPMAAVCWALGEASNVRFIGLCHGVQTTLDLISRYVGVPKERDRLPLRRHQPHGVVPQLEHQGRDLYPTRANCEAVLPERRCAAR